MCSSDLTWRWTYGDIQQVSDGGVGDLTSGAQPDVTLQTYYMRLWAYLPTTSTWYNITEWLSDSRHWTCTADETVYDGDRKWLKIFGDNGGSAITTSDTFVQFNHLPERILGTGTVGDYIPDPGTWVLGTNVVQYRVEFAVASGSGGPWVSGEFYRVRSLAAPVNILRQGDQYQNIHVDNDTSYTDPFDATLEPVIVRSPDNVSTVTLGCRAIRAGTPTLSSLVLEATKWDAVDTETGAVMYPAGRSANAALTEIGRAHV